jgi:hypothetical protein
MNLFTLYSDGFVFVPNVDLILVMLQMFLWPRIDVIVTLWILFKSYVLLGSYTALLFPPTKRRGGTQTTLSAGWSITSFPCPSCSKHGFGCLLILVVFHGYLIAIVLIIGTPIYSEAVSTRILMRISIERHITPTGESHEPQTDVQLIYQSLVVTNIAILKTGIVIYPN